MNNEFERKFILKEYPAILDQFKEEKVKQWYISKPTDNISIRIRLYDDNRCYLDFKKGLGMVRYEYGVKCVYDDIKGLINDVPYVEKYRYKLRTDKYLLIIDEFDFGLKLVEIESDDLEFIKSFKPFHWMGDEVTDRLEYTNNWLAYNKKGQF